MLVVSKNFKKLIRLTYGEYKNISFAKLSIKKDTFGSMSLKLLLVQAHKSYSLLVHALNNYSCFNCLTLIILTNNTTESF